MDWRQALPKTQCNSARGVTERMRFADGQQQAGRWGVAARCALKLRQANAAVALAAGWKTCTACGSTCRVRRGRITAWLAVGREVRTRKATFVLQTDEGLHGYSPKAAGLVRNAGKRLSANRSAPGGASPQKRLQEL